MVSDYDYSTEKASKIGEDGIIREGTAITLWKPWKRVGEQSTTIFVANSRPEDIEGIYSTGFLRLGGFDVFGSDGKKYYVRIKKR